VAVELRHHLGVERVMFATDFPHIECEWPNSRPAIEPIYADVPPEERDKIWAGNAVNFFRLR
jgi:predicted TIM-barrel fold metal-dependent hydrolase